MRIIKEFVVDSLNIKVLKTRNDMGRLAGETIGSRLKELLHEKKEINVILDLSTNLVTQM